MELSEENVRGDSDVRDKYKLWTDLMLFVEESPSGPTMSISRVKLEQGHAMLICIDFFGVYKFVICRFKNNVRYNKVYVKSPLSATSMACANPVWMVTQRTRGYAMASY